MLSPGEHIKLLLHQINQDLMLSDLRLTDGLDSALDLRLSVEAFTYLAERAFTKGAPDLIPVMNIFCCLEALKEAELEDFLAFGR